MARRSALETGLELGFALFPQVSLDQIAARAARHHLEVLGAFHPEPDHKAPDGVGTMVLLGPSEPGFWDHFKSSSEWADREADSLDRWSERVITGIAETVQGRAYFPFGGPPYHAFYRWALAGGECWESPVSLLVHARAGLMVSFRGAIGLHEKLDLPQRPRSPCDECAKPCLSECPAKALTGDGYDVPACHAYLDGPNGAKHLKMGCSVRRACPISQSYGRLPEQSAYHMGLFHPREIT